VSLTKCIRTVATRAGRCEALRACVMAISWPAYTPGPVRPPAVRACRAPCGDRAISRAVSRYLSPVTIPRATSANVGERRRLARLARLAKVALKFTPPTTEDSLRRSDCLSLPHYYISSRRRFRCHYARYYGCSRLRSVRARGSKRVTSARDESRGYARSYVSAGMASH